MTTLVAVCASVLVGVWVVETLLFVFSYRMSARTEASRSAEPL